MATSISIAATPTSKGMAAAVPTPGHRIQSRKGLSSVNFSGPLKLSEVSFLTISATKPFLSEICIGYRLESCEDPSKCLPKFVLTWDAGQSSGANFHGSNSELPPDQMAILSYPSARNECPLSYSSKGIERIPAIKI